MRGPRRTGKSDRRWRLSPLARQACALHPAWIGGVVAAAMLATAAAAPPERDAQPTVSIRADHMVLDAAVDGSRLVVGTQSGRVDAYDWTTGATLDSLLASEPAEGEPFAPTIRSLALSPDGKRLVTVSSDGALRLFSLEPGRAGLVSTREVAAPMVVRFLDDRRVLLGNMRGELVLFDLEARAQVYRRQLEYDPIYALALSPDRSRLAVALRASRIHLLDPQTGEARRVLRGHRDSVFGLTWLSDRELATAGKDKQLFAWDLREAEPRPRALYSGDHYITALAADEQRTLLALPLEDFAIGLLPLEGAPHAEPLEHHLRGHTAPVQRLLFVAGGMRLISTGYDGRILVWNLEGVRP